MHLESVITYFRAALACIGAMYESLGRLVGRSYEESYHHMSKWIKNAEVVSLLPESSGRMAVA